MIIINDVLVPVEFKKNLHFCCDLKKCKGACCVLGDAGAPLEDWEVDKIQECLPIVKPFMQTQIAEKIDENSVFDFDLDGNLVTALHNSTECVFTFFERGIAYCAIEKAFNLKLIDFRKPISCYLYPIRIDEKANFSKISYHRWDICQPAIELGNNKKIKLVDFIKNPLKEKFGRDWLKMFYEAIKK